MKLGCFKLRLVIEIDSKTTIVITHQQATTVKAPGANRGTMLFVSQSLAIAGVAVKGKSFQFPTTGDFQVALIYDPECDLVVARVAHYDETQAFLDRRIEEADRPKAEIQSIIETVTDLENEVYSLENEVENADQDAEA